MIANDNPFRYTWNWFSTALGVIGLASIFDDVIAWNGFIDRIVTVYQHLIYPIFTFLFSWLPFRLPHWVFDYLVFGVIVASSWVRTQITQNVLKGYGYWIIDWPALTKEAAVCIILWPGLILACAERWFQNGRFDEARSIAEWRDFHVRNPTKENLEEKIARMVRLTRIDHQEPETFFFWLGAVCLGFLAVLILNGVLSHG